MIFLDPLFAVFCLTTILIAQFSPRGLAPLALSLGVSLLFMLLFLGPVQAAILLGFSAIGFAGLQLVARGYRAGLAIGVGGLLLLFIVLKKYSFLPEALTPAHLPVAIGLSYVLFRLIHLLVEHGADADTRPGLLRHLGYTLSAHALVSGPFQRYDEYEEIRERATRHEPLPAMARFVDGLLKVVIVAPLVQGLHAALERHGAGPLGYAVLLVAALVWVVYMYFNFSGYMDIVIGWARLCRLDLPENFDRPLLANGFHEFWSRWHMTMTHWFKTHLFNPLMIAFGRRFAPTRRMAMICSSLAFFFTFLLVGAWHGPTTPFLICGLLLGLGATANQISRETARGRKKPAEPGAGARLLTLLGASLTFLYISVAVSPFWLDQREFLGLLASTLKPVNLLVLLPSTLIGTAIALLVLRPIESRLHAVGQAAAPMLQSAPLIALRVVVLALFILGFGNAAPDFVYQGI